MCVSTCTGRPERRGPDPVLWRLWETQMKQVSRASIGSLGKCRQIPEPLAGNSVASLENPSEGGEVSGSFLSEEHHLCRGGPGRRRPCRMAWAHHLPIWSVQPETTGKWQGIECSETGSAVNPVST